MPMSPWGSDREALRANDDSFFYTNIAPQHEEFNRSSMRGLWGELENSVLMQSGAQRQRLSVLGGPIFSTGDPKHRGAIDTARILEVDRLSCA